MKVVLVGLNVNCTKKSQTRTIVLNVKIECLKGVTGMPNDGMYIEVFAVKNGVRYNARILNIKDVSLILTNSLMDGVGEIIMDSERRKDNNAE